MPALSNVASGFDQPIPILFTDKIFEVLLAVCLQQHSHSRFYSLSLCKPRLALFIEICLGPFPFQSGFTFELSLHLMLYFY